MSENEKGFEINDRRRVDAEGKDTGAPTGEPRRLDENKAEEAGELPAMDFMSFVGSLGANALMHMGARLTPDQPELPKDLAAARQMIGLIELLKDKTQGNLEKEESEGLENMLYNLRMLYVAESGKK